MNHYLQVDPKAKYKMRTDRLKRLIVLEAPYKIIYNECKLVMLACTQMDFPDICVSPLTTMNKLIEELQKDQLDSMEAINETSEPM